MNAHHYRYDPGYYQRIRHEGAMAAAAKVPYTENPYPCPTKDSEHFAWAQGWWSACPAAVQLASSLNQE